MPTNEDIKSQIQKLIADRPSISLTLLFDYSPAFNLVHQLVSETEIITGYCFGNLTQKGMKLKAGQWLTICTNQQILFLYKGMLTGLTHYSIPLGQVSSVTAKEGWLFGNIKIRDNNTEWELFQIGKKDFRFFEPPLTDTLAKFRK